MKKFKKLKFLDLFCGCGGFSSGMEQAGHECLLGVDFNKDAIGSFELNHPKAKSFHGDIHDLTKKKLKELIGTKKVDMVIGGPPCQGFSTVGKGDANDNRNSLFKQFVRIVKETSPEIVMFENVTGMLAQKNRFVLKQIFKEFEKLGYHLEARVLSAEEFGVPEKRRRAFIIGAKKGVEISFPEVTHGVREEGLDSFVTVEKALKVLKKKNHFLTYHDVDKAQVKNVVDRQRLKHIPAGRGIRYERDEKEFLPKKLRYDVNWEELREGRFRQTKLQRLDPKKPSPTILTARTAYFHYSEDRYLTPREAALLQGFAIDFEFFGSQTAVFRQIGNAVPPMLGKVLGECAARMIAQKKRARKTLKSGDAINDLDSQFDFVQSAFVYKKLTKI